MNIFPEIILIIVSSAIFIAALAGGLVSIFEKEERAAKRFLVLAIFLPLPFLAVAFYNSELQSLLAIILLATTFLTALFLLIPIGNKKSYRHPIPVSRIDERDTMFSRNEIKPGTQRFEEYYLRKPENKAADDLFRSKAGLLKPGSSQYNPIHFASADASFETIGDLKNKVNGEVSEKQTIVDNQDISAFIKAWSRKLGALDCGITELKDYHLYSVGGRADRYGKEVVNSHKFAIAFTVEMDKEMVDSAPTGSIVMESAQQYLESGKIALQVANFIRNLGYEARAHIDGNYEVVCPLVARDAGLGEIGRMGLLMTPKLGPRVRVSVVTTNLPLVINPPLHDYSMIDFCEKCKKCADACPSNAISLETRKDINGVKRWQINQEACFTLWCQIGTDCGRCVSVCPYSHPDNFLHNVVRAGLNNSSIFRSVALKLDDFFYGRKPPVSPLPDWLKINEESHHA